MATKRKTILFFAECVTLAHMARPASLAKSLPSSEFQVIFASDNRYDRLFPDLPRRRERIFSIDSDRFLDALANGKPLYDVETLRRYVKDDLAVIDRVKPDVIVGDFRLSLSVSARVAKIPYLTITNVYWSPYAVQRYPVPQLPITKSLGVGISQVLFAAVRPFAFSLHTRPLNSVRKEYGLPSLGLDLRKIYTDADVTLYADTPGLVATKPLPSNHRYIGPVLWSPVVPVPDWWDNIDPSNPIFYLTPGSSGSLNRLRDCAAAVASLPATVLVATAGRLSEQLRLPNVFEADFLPGEDTAKRADIVICNGGSPTTSQALAAGKPIIGIPSNLDQFLNMTAIEKAGLGLLIRPEKATAERLRECGKRILEDPGFRQRADAMRLRMNRLSSSASFLEAIRISM